MSAVDLREATPADVAQITELVAAAYGRYVDELGFVPRPLTEDYSDVVSRAQVSVAEREGEMVGLLVLDTDDEGFFVDNVAVAPSAQGAGVGRLLLDHAEAQARLAGFDSIYLYTHERATVNLAIYERLGYVEYDRRAIGDAKIVYLRKPLS
jgi:ribosomal protein S18 acetylase RimI-like enzyme